VGIVFGVLFFDATERVGKKKGLEGAPPPRGTVRSILGLTRLVWICSAERWRRAKKRSVRWTEEFLEGTKSRPATPFATAAATPPQSDNLTAREVDPGISSQSPPASALAFRFGPRLAL